MHNRFFQTALAACIGAAPLLIATARCLADVTYQDGTFNDADWSITSQGVGNGGMISVAQASSGGNPGDYRTIVLTVNPAVDASHPSVEIAAHLMNGAVYTPSSSGAIGGIDFSIDAILLQGFGNGIAGGVALEQNGTVFYSDYGAKGVYTSPDRTWTNHVLSNLEAGDFFTAGDWLTAASGQKPDFSSTGAPISLGFYSEDGTNNTGYSITGGVDNWLLTVHSVPEPAGAGLLVISALAGAMMRRRRRETNVG